MREQGIHFAKYTIVPRTLIFVFHRDSVLLLKGAMTKKIWPGLYNGIGGHVEPGENVLESARRELNEETGIEGIRLDCCAQIMVDVELSTGVGLFIFKGQAENLEVLSSEEGKPEWIKVSEVFELPLVKDLFRLLPKVIQWQPGDPILFGRYYYSETGELLSVFSD